ncbi:MAG: pyridoxal-phosphate dependent enzyme [Niastella sp.]|nr:pyridoxal-phosphate dependent enzyme [Niastella sp.]
MPAINTYQPVDYTKAIVQPIPNESWHAKGVHADVLRLDLIHPVLSGNKWFKLKYYLQQAKAQKQGILTFGGAYSNHLVATAIACKLEDIPAIGIVRGEPATTLSPTLLEVQTYGMQLQFVSRTTFQDEQALIASMQEAYPGYLIVPAGGQGAEGVRGATEILSLANRQAYTQIACAIGTGTMFTGLIKALFPHQHALGFSSLKIADHQHNSILDFIKTHAAPSRFSVIYDYHFGGYARKNSTLIDFMNNLYKTYTLPTDFVYTGKLMYGINELIHNDYFPIDSRILLIHSGGLQGNRSLAPGILTF